MQKSLRSLCKAPASLSPRLDPYDCSLLIGFLLKINLFKHLDLFSSLFALFYPVYPLSAIINEKVGPGETARTGGKPGRKHAHFTSEKPEIYLSYLETHCNAVSHYIAIKLDCFPGSSDHEYLS